MFIVKLRPARLKANSHLQDYSNMYPAAISNWRIVGKPNLWHPPTDVYETDEKIIVRVEIAGMSEENFLVSFDHNLLSIAGTRSEVAEKRAFHQMEIFFGEFITEIEIPVPIDTESILAEYQGGFLYVYLPKEKPKVIKIEED